MSSTEAVLLMCFLIGFRKIATPYCWHVQESCWHVQEWYKTVLILVTPFWVAGAAESMEIGKIVIGASNKSGRCCKPSDEFQLIYLMSLVLSVIRQCLRNRFLDSIS